MIIRPIVIDPSFDTIESFDDVEVTLTDNGYAPDGAVLGDTVTRTSGTWTGLVFAGDLIRLRGPTTGDVMPYRVMSVDGATLRLSGNDQLTTGGPQTVSVVRGRKPDIVAVVIEARDDLDILATGVLNADATHNILIGAEHDLPIGTLRTPQEVRDQGRGLDPQRQRHRDAGHRLRHRAGRHARLHPDPGQHLRGRGRARGRRRQHRADRPRQRTAHPDLHGSPRRLRPHGARAG